MIDRRSVAAGAAALAVAGCAGQGAIQVNVLPNDPAGAPDPVAGLATGRDVSQRVTAPVRINGQGPFEFVLDTGANRTVICAELAARLGLPDGGQATVHGVAGAEPAATAIIGLFEADSVVARGLRAPAIPRERLGADGLLGVDVLHDRRVLIDLVNHRLTISGDRSIAPDLTSFDLRTAQTGVAADLGRRFVVPARYRFGQLIIIGADIAGRSVTAFVDSGSQSTVGNNALRRLIDQGDPADPQAARYISPIYSATGQTAQGELRPMPLLRIGGLYIRGLNTVFADLHVFEIWDLLNRPSLLLGMDILSRFNAIELNYGRREVAFYLPARARR